MNELAVIFERMNLDTHDVLAAAATKWNFLNFTPGLVGGHCIGVDPYYLTHRAEQVGYHPEVILAGRRINNGMGQFLARESVKRLMKRGADGRLGVIVLGITFKEDVPDVRNTLVTDLIRELQSFGIGVQAHDPLADPDGVAREYGIRMVPERDLMPADAVILAVPHRRFRDAGWPLVSGLLKKRSGLVIDVRACLDRAATPPGIALWRL
jgi:UDP-N-acetyl-D-galactosamine dehydrogenase